MSDRLSSHDRHTSIKTKLTALTLHVPIEKLNADESRLREAVWASWPRSRMRTHAMRWKDGAWGLGRVRSA